MYPLSLSTWLTDDDTEDLAAVETLIIPTDEDTRELCGSMAINSVARSAATASLPLQDPIQASTVDASLSFSAATSTPPFAAISLSGNAAATPSTDTPPRLGLFY